MTAEPSRVVVLQWLELTGKSQSEAVDHFWPDALDAERKRIEARVRKWVQRARAAGEATVAPPLAGPEPATGPPPPRPTGAPGVSALSVEQGQLDFLETQLRERLQDHATVRAAGRWKDADALDRRISAIRRDLDLARERESRIVRLPRSPAEICAELARRYDAIALRAEMRRRVMERDNRESMSLEGSKSGDES